MKINNFESNIKTYSPLVSVIIPTYNASQTITRCLNSVLSQTYQNIEIITCDDCSSDHTVSIIKEIANKHQNIKILSLINKTNSGAAYTRNNCIKYASGKYVAQIDDDDYCAVDRIQKQVDYLEQHPDIDICGTGAYFFDETGVWGGSKYTFDYKPEKKDFLWNSCFINPTTLLTKKSLLDVGCYRVAKETRRGQDYDLYMRLYSKGYKGIVLAEKLTYYYRGRNNFKKCKYKYRIDELKIRYKNFKTLGLLPKYILYVLKPLLVGLVPIALIEKLKNRNN